MDARSETEVQRNSEREVVVTRTVNGPARIVFEAWTKPELFQRWWMPKSMGVSIVSCEMDVRVGGGYRLMVRREGARVRCFTKNGHDWTDRFPTIAEAATQLQTLSFLIDGEAVVLNDDGTPNEIVAGGAIAGSGTNLLPGAGSLFSFAWVHGVRKPFKLLACVSYLDDTERRFTQSYLLELNQAPGEENRINLNEIGKFNQDKCPEVRA